MSARRSSALPLSRVPALPHFESSREGGPVDRLAFFKRELDDDLVVRGDAWVKESGAQQQLEFDGYRLRWVPANRLTSTSRTAGSMSSSPATSGGRGGFDVVTDFRTSTSSSA